MLQNLVFMHLFSPPMSKKLSNITKSQYGGKDNREQLGVILEYYFRIITNIPLHTKNDHRHDLTNTVPNHETRGRIFQDENMLWFLTVEVFGLYSSTPRGI